MKHVLLTEYVAALLAWKYSLVFSMFHNSQSGCFTYITYLKVASDEFIFVYIFTINNTLETPT